MKKKRKFINIEKIRTAIADYMTSEGCSCCRNIDEHDKNKRILAEMLNVEMYNDKSGYDFYKYNSEELKK